jgi:hypothetical protein
VDCLFARVNASPASSSTNPCAVYCCKSCTLCALIIRCHPVE